jgi:hypothetical protein
MMVKKRMSIVTIGQEVGCFMYSNYKYSPNDFSGILGLASELSVFYKMYETYRTEKTQHTRFALEKHWTDLFFTIKHRALEGTITQNTAHEICSYIEELLYD